MLLRGLKNGNAKACRKAAEGFEVKDGGDLDKGGAAEMERSWQVGDMQGV